MGRLGLFVFESFLLADYVFFSTYFAIHFNIIPEKILPESIPNFRAEKYLV